MNRPDPFHRAIYLTGPTASGKTAVGVALAERLGAEVVALDSMSLYRDMDIGTAKPTVEERRGIPHHLIDILDPWDESASVAAYRGWAGAVLFRFTEWMLVIPFLPLAIVLASVLGRSLLNIVIVIGVTSWPGTALLIRAQTLSVKERAYLERSRALGAGHGHLGTGYLSPSHGDPGGGDRLHRHAAAVDPDPDRGHRHP